ncbi:MAG: LysR family transcriptional regulator ArgP [Mobilicoccus sp.]|nr:LysR family transcriptional regulator ArgP [Mobilicoccus sp.]
MNLDHLAALVAVVDEGSFDAAARALHVTPSAISQRIKALEKEHGRVLLVRSSPARPTGDGEVFLRFARQVARLQTDVLAELNPTTTRRHLPLVVNADSLATWFVPVLAEAAGWDDVRLELLVEMEDHGTRHLRTGAAVGAVTSDPVAVTGCSVEPLGRLRYLPVCTPGLRDEHSRSGEVDWGALPMMQFDDRDDLQHRLLRSRDVNEPDVVHLVPDNHAFLAAIRAGLGWGLVPEAQLAPLPPGELVRLTDDVVDTELSWQSWRLPSRVGARLTEAVRRAARVGLRR